LAFVGRGRKGTWSAVVAVLTHRKFRPLALEPSPNK
jgi:hypothetical protein